MSVTIRLEIMERMERLRSGGATYPQIAAAFGVTTDQAWRAVTKALPSLRRAMAAEAAATHPDRIDEFGIPRVVRGVFGMGLHAVVWTPELDAYIRGRREDGAGDAVISAELGVCQATVAKRRRVLGLANFAAEQDPKQRLAAAEIKAARVALMRADGMERAEIVAALGVTNGQYDAMARLHATRENRTRRFAEGRELRASAPSVQRSGARGAVTWTAEMDCWVSGLVNAGTPVETISASLGISPRLLRRRIKAGHIVIAPKPAKPEPARPERGYDPLPAGHPVAWSVLTEAMTREDGSPIFGAFSRQTIQIGQRRAEGVAVAAFVPPAATPAPGRAPQAHTAGNRGEDWRLAA